MKDQKFDPRGLEAFKAILERQKALISELASVKSGLGLVKYLLRLRRLIEAKAPTKSDVKVIKYFCKEVFRLVKGGGIPFAILYLKVCSILLQQYVAKHTNRASSWEIGKVGVSVTRTGLPRIIPRVNRVSIRRGDVKIVSLWLSLFNLYRYLESTHKFKGYSTIVDPGVGWIPTNEFWNAVAHFWNALKKITKIPKLVPTLPHLFDKVSVNITEALGVTGSSLHACALSVWSWRSLGLITNYAATIRGPKLFGEGRWKKIKYLFPSLLEVGKKTAPWLKTVMTGSVFWNPPKDIKTNNPGELVGWLRSRPAYDFSGQGPTTLSTDTEHKSLQKDFAPRSSWVKPSTGPLDWKTYPFGRLVKLMEAAGKIRVIAIVDPITQWVLKPIHDWLFSILANIPQDGTFNQDLPIAKLWKQNRGKYIGSCDMTAATDRLPVILQAHLLSHILGKDVATAWMRLLVNRQYWHSMFGSVMYAVGQPMGALSSWAALAITHHFLWQWSALRAKVVRPGQWYTPYAVLGDDSASANKRVVDEYLAICSEIGVGVNLAKSLLSPNGCLEFAKRFWTPRGNASPVSIGEIFVADVNFSTMANWPRKRTIRPADLLAIMGYRHKVIGAFTSAKIKKLPRKARNMLIVLTSPWGPYPSSSLMAWLTLDRWGSSKDTFSGYPVIEILLMAGKLLEKVSKSVLKNGLPLQMFGIGGSKMGEKLVASVRHKDPKTAIAILQSVYEPQRLKVFNESKSLLREIHEFRKRLIKDAFTDHSPSIEAYWEEYLALETRLHNMRPWVYLQKPDKPFVPSSPIQMVKLWNRLRSK